LSPITSSFLLFWFFINLMKTTHHPQSTQHESISPINFEQYIIYTLLTACKHNLWPNSSFSHFNFHLVFPTDL
jgi:hypothetical protein